jgi:uncharacterized protein (TIGR02172 family)
VEIKKEKLIGQGNTAEIYKLDNDKILKLFRNGLHKSIVEREFENGNAVQKILNSSVPKVYEMVEIDGRNGIIYEEIKGTDFLKIMVSSIWKITDNAKKLAHYHLEIQKPVDDKLLSVKEKLEDDLNHVSMISEEQKAIIRNYLQQLPEDNILCHFDFHPGNIMIADNKAMYLDWMTACRGEASADVARTCVMLKYGEVAHAPWVMKKLISIVQHRIYKVYIKEYLISSKYSMEDIVKWELPVAAARLREWISEKEKQVLIKLINERCNEIMYK